MCGCVRARACVCVCVCVCVCLCVSYPESVSASLDSFDTAAVTITTAIEQFR
jgi:hypothetical protein